MNYEKFIKFDRDYISNCLNNRESKNIQRWLDENARELPDANGIYSEVQVLILMYLQKKFKWAQNLMFRLHKDGAFSSGMLECMLGVIENDASTKVTHAPGAISTVVFEGENRFIKEDDGYGSGDIVVVGDANVIRGSSTGTMVDGNITNMGEYGFIYNHSSNSSSLTFNKGDRSVVVVEGLRSSIVNTGQNSTILDDSRCAVVHNTGCSSAISGRGTIHNSGDFCTIHVDEPYAVVMSSGEATHIKISAPECYVSLREYDRPLIEIGEGSEGSVVSFTYRHIDTERLEVAVGRGSLVILEGGSSVDNICIEGGVEVRGINGTTWGISPGRLLTQLNERR